MKIRFKFLILGLLVSGFLFSQKINTSLTYSVNLPSKKTSKTPVLILLHGYGSNEADLFDLGKTMDPTFITFSLRAPNQTRDGGFCWYAMEFLPNQQFKYDYKQVIESKKKILSFISNACRTYKLDSTQIFLLGFSQGAIMSYEIALSSPDKVKGVLALSGRLLDESRLHHADPEKISKLKFFIGHGNSDNVIKIQEAEKANAYLKEKAIREVTYKAYEMPHSITGAELNDLKSWLVKAIAPPAQKPAIKK